MPARNTSQRLDSAKRYRARHQVSTCMITQPVKQDLITLQKSLGFTSASETIDFLMGEYQSKNN